MIYGQILNYLLASLVRSSFAEVGRVSVASTPNPKLGLAMRRDIPAQRNRPVACECIGYVLNDLIGSEGNAYRPAKLDGQSRNRKKVCRYKTLQCEASCAPGGTL